MVAGKGAVEGVKDGEGRFGRERCGHYPEDASAILEIGDDGATSDERGTSAAVNNAASGRVAQVGRGIVGHLEVGRGFLRDIPKAAADPAGPIDDQEFGCGGSAWSSSINELFRVPMSTEPMLACNHSSKPTIASST